MIQLQINDDIDIEQSITNLKGKHIKSILTRLEKLDALTPALRKIILDELNDLTRETLRFLGFDVPD